MTLPSDPKARKNLPVATGPLDYFPDALLAVAEVCKAGNDQHNPGQPLHWARGKSMDHADALVRHLMDRGALDTDGLRHSAKTAWRALALLQEELEKGEGRPMSRGSRLTVAPQLEMFEYQYRYRLSGTTQNLETGWFETKDGAFAALPENCSIFTSLETRAKTMKQG